MGDPEHLEEQMSIASPMASPNLGPARPPSIATSPMSMSRRGSGQNFFNSSHGSNGFNFNGPQSPVLSPQFRLSREGDLPEELSLDDAVLFHFYT